MQLEALAMEHHRYHVIEQWPEGAMKQAALAGVRSAIEALLRFEGPGVWNCMVCGRSGLPPRVSWSFELNGDISKGYTTAQYDKGLARPPFSVHTCIH